MTTAQDEDTEDKPLDPTLERVQARLRRLMLFSTATLGLGFIAVLVAVIFRVSNLGETRSSDGAPWRSALDVPAGASIVDTALDGERIAITVESAGSRSILVYDLASGRRLGEASLIAR